MNYYNDSSFIPGVESWALSDDPDINAEITINTEEEADEAEEQALEDTATNEQAGADLQEEDQQVTMQLHASLRGLDDISRMVNYLQRGGNERDVMALYDMRLYVQGGFVPGTESLADTLKSAGNSTVAFLKKMLEKIVTIFQKLLPWFGQNLTTLETRQKALLTKANALVPSNANANLKASTSDRKVVKNSSEFARIGKGIFGAKLSANLIKREATAKDHNVSSIVDILKAVGTTIADLKKQESEVKKRLADANAALKEITTNGLDGSAITRKRKAAVKAKKDATESIKNIRIIARTLTGVLNDAKFLIGQAS